VATAATSLPPVPTVRWKATFEKQHLVQTCNMWGCSTTLQLLDMSVQKPPTHPSNFTDLTTPSIHSAGFHHLYNAHNKWRQWAAFIYMCVCIYIYIYIYIECPRRNVPDFGRVFLMLKYTNITQNTYVQSWTVTEIMASEKWGLLAVPNTATCTADTSCDNANVLDSGMQCSLCLCGALRSQPCYVTTGLSHV